jgi:hypothetical protein
MEGYLWANQVPLTGFGAHVNEISGRVKDAALQCVREARRTVRYLRFSKDDKEAIARSIAREQKITEGPVSALTCVEPCWGFDISSQSGNQEAGLGSTVAQVLPRLPAGATETRIARGRLRGQQSDDHVGLKKTIPEVLIESAWQRCYVQFLRSALDYLPRKANDDRLMELRWMYDRRTLDEGRRDLAAWLVKWSGRYPKLCDRVEITSKRPSPSTGYRGSITEI